ncbi:uncharacterized protein TRIREDRAFT_102960 [Trichoderma reesei QM6a]|uniref:Predicted protein n=1 Tax=Hypocrea jecorina (strain QM6a) TaxID=431241 RepID=G0R8S1_HYPJQ|nr:uncharacterized protein TRIREDRAFT_102960 [Trichoderma reesei QM6a]EGR52935.1 predicted protein [Trichoderma reesei QM6a]
MASSSSTSQQQGQPPPAPQTTTATTTQTAPQPPQPVHAPAGFQPLVYDARNAIPYAPIPLPQQIFETPEPEPNRPWELTKTALQVLSVVLGATGVGLGFSTLKYEYFYATVLISTIPPTQQISDNRGIHPGAHVALSLIIFLLGAILPALFGPWFQDSWNGYGSGSDYPWQDCSNVYDPTTHRYVYTCTDDDDARRRYLKEKKVAMAAAVITFIVAVMHFGLFVGACVDTDRVNRVAKRPIYVVAPPPPPQMMQWQPVPQTMPQQQYQQYQQQYQAPMQQTPMQQAPLQTTAQPPAQETPQTETESQSRDKGKGKATDKGKGKEPMRDPIVEEDAPSGSQA